jgi:hypothetical protein
LNRNGGKASNEAIHKGDWLAIFDLQKFPVGKMFM